MKDRSFFSDRDRFAELMNTCLFEGEEILHGEELQLLKRSYPSLAASAGEKSRDVLMQSKRQGVCYGLEIETESDYAMPERALAYDVCEYEYQIRELCKRHEAEKDYRDYREKKSRIKEEDMLLPVVTVVLYLGNGHWEGRKRLSQMFQMSEKVGKLLEQWIYGYEIPLIEADHERPEDYQTDLREFFYAMQCRKDKKRLEELFQTERFRHLSRETEEVIAVHLQIKELTRKMEKEGVSMCQAYEDLKKEWLWEGKQEGRLKGREEGKREGKEEGKKEGKREERIDIISRMLKEGMDELLISRITECTKEELATAAGR